jgi:hypothetical protein
MRALAEDISVEPIDEVDGKKKRRTMYENMQRSSALFQSKLTKANDQKAAEKAQQQQAQQAKDDDSLDFSSEFTNQDSNLSSGDQKSDVIANWEDILDDDDWLSEEEEDEDGEGSEGGKSGEEYDEGDSSEPAADGPPEEWKPPPKKGGFFNSSFGKTSASAPLTEKSEKTEEKPAKVEGFEWGAVGKKKPVLPPRKSPPQESATPEPVRQGGTVPLSATRRGGWQESTPTVIPRARPVCKMLPVRGQLEQVEDSLVRAARLLIATPEDEPGYEECIRLLGRFGLGAIRICSKAKIKIHILDELGFTEFDELVEMGLDPEEFPVDGAYLVKSKVCLVDRRCLTEKPRFFHPALYYFAHALDHAQGGDDFSSRKAAAVLACFESSASGYNGADFVDELAATDPVRYFARAVSIYLGRDDCDDPIWTHQDLFDFDRSMYDYLQYLFARFAV